MVSSPNSQDIKHSPFVLSNLLCLLCRPTRGRHFSATQCPAEPMLGSLQKAPNAGGPQPCPLWPVRGTI